MSAARRRWGWLLAAVAVLAVVTVAVPALRVTLLRAAGWALVVDEPLAPADIVVIAVDADGAGVLEAADLVHGGIAPAVAVFEDPPDAVDREFLRRGVPYEDQSARSMRQLRSLNVTAVEQIPAAVTGSESEGGALAAWCDRRHFRTIVLVTTPDHSRRLHRLLRRAMRGRPTRVIVRATRYAAFQPEAWWTTRVGVRTEIVELQKLLLDVIRHPLS